jgi:hypothetical protein
VRARGLSPRTSRAYALDVLIFFRWLHATNRQLETLVAADLVPRHRECDRFYAAVRRVERLLGVG